MGLWWNSNPSPEDRFLRDLHKLVLKAEDEFSPEDVRSLMYRAHDVIFEAEYRAKLALSTTASSAGTTVGFLAGGSRKP